MIRSLEQTGIGLGRLTLIPESDEERAELETVRPSNLPAGVRVRHEWNDNGALVLIAELDPEFKKPVEEKEGPPGFKPLPSREKLGTWSIDDLVTRAAELGVKHVAGETKAALIAKLVPAWGKSNASTKA